MTVFETLQQQKGNKLAKRGKDLNCLLMSAQPVNCLCTELHAGNEQEDLKQFPGILKTNKQIDNNISILEMLTPGSGLGPLH